MSKLLAIISLSYKESIRKKIFLVVIAFTFILVVLSSFMPVVNAQDRIRIVEIWALQGIGFLGILMAIFLAAVSLPDDIEMKRMLLILPKPISRETLIIGKMLGFVLTIGVFVAIMGVVSLVYLYILAGANSGLNYLEVRQEIKASEMYFQSAAEGKAGGEVKANDDSEITPGPDKIHGNYLEKRGVAVTLEGNPDNFVGWRFAGLNQNNPPTHVRLNLMLGEGMKVSTIVRLRVQNPTTKEELTRELTLSYKQPETLEFPASLIGPTGELQVYVYRIEPSSYVTATPEAVVLVSRPMNFAWNFIKALALIWMQIILVLAFCIAGSTFLSAGINVFLNIVIYFVGSGVKFWGASLETMKRAMEQAIKIEALQQTTALTGQPAPQVSADAFPLWMMQMSDFVVRTSLQIFPDFQRFDMADYLLGGKTIDATLFPPLLGYLLFYGLVVFVIGIIVFRLRDV